MKKIRIGISTCPNDTFAFHGLLTGAVKVPGVELEFSLLDIEQLNEGLMANRFDVAKASFHLALHLADRYFVLPSGSALGFGVGPLLLAAEGGQAPSAHQLSHKLTLCPGRFTTASLLFEMFYPKSTRIEQVVFSDIMPRLIGRMADFGVCIHEGRFTWQDQNLSLVEDLGTRWESETQMPLPLGGILASKDLPTETIRGIQEGIRQSIEMAMMNPKMAIPTMREYAQEFNDDILMKHVKLYVNDWTIDLGDLGRRALAVMFERAKESRSKLINTNATHLEVFD